ncbi:MAG TPA: hypothetical protein VNL77_25305 [Roseiflexaceae bacterium]|nr:hypothetical protein [Roseiflexaceae bacterium]
MTAKHETAATLGVVARLFKQLNDQGVRYCHWKSTHGLPRALRGKTDLDLLVGRGDARRFKAVLYQLDFKPLVSDPSRQFPAIEDYLGFDPATGDLVHLHVHYRLVLGEQYVKNYVLPLEQAFLDNTRLQWGVKVPAPELEIAVLALRVLLKYRNQDALRDALGLGRRGGIPPALLDELAYLLAQTSRDEIDRALRRHITCVSPELIQAFLDTIRDAPRDGRALLRLRGRARRELAPYRRYGWLRSRAAYLQGMITRQWPFDRIMRRIAPGLEKRKRPASGGLGLAFVGADGAGKSTIIAQITKWLGWRLDVRTYYLGASRPSLVTRALKGVSGLAGLAHAGCRRLFGAGSAPARLAAWPRDLLKHLRYLAEGRDRYRRYLASRREAAQGTIVVYDRYPLEAVRVFNRTVDGPRIAASSEGPLGPLSRRLAQIEERMYRKIRPPEHVFVLHVSPDVSQARKPEHARELIEAKSRAIETIAREDLDLIDVDADRPVDEVLLQIKTALWRLL